MQGRQGQRGKEGDRESNRRKLICKCKEKRRQLCMGKELRSGNMRYKSTGGKRKKRRGYLGNYEMKKVMQKRE